MPWKSNPDIWGVIGALVIAAVSGLIAVANRLAGGQPFSWLWFITQLAGALLAGYLMWDLYPYIKDSLYDWCTQPIMISIAAHYGGKFFSLAEYVLSRRFNLPQDRS